MLTVRWGLLPSIAGAMGIFVGASSVSADTAGAADTCAPDTLGVSRVIEVDTTGGPRFGAPGPEPFPLLEDKEVILTFDDGPMRRFTRPILEALDEECTKATFYIVGRMALSDPTTLQDTSARGHTIALHSWSHKRLDRIGATASKQEIELGLSATKLALGQPVAPFFRFPYLGESSAMRAHLQARNIANVAIDVDSRDFLTRNPSIMRRNVMSQLAKKGRGIILFHDIQPATAGGLRALLDELKEKEYRVVHMVPKSSIETLPEFDAMAEREAQRRKLGLSLQPLANRSAVWPMTPGEQERLPWATNVLPPSTAIEPALQPLPPRTAKPKVRPSLNKDDWATNPLGQP